MSNSRFPILLTICLGCLGLVPNSPGLGLSHLYQSPTVLAQPIPPAPTQRQPPVEVTPTPTPAKSPPREAPKYDSLMERGYSAMSKKDFQSAVKLFKEALQERPEDAIAKTALEDAQAQMLGKSKNEKVPEQRPFPWLLALGIPLLGIALLGALVPLIAKKYRTNLKVSKPPRTKYTATKTDPNSFNDLEGSDKGFSFGADTEEGSEWNPSLPVQTTTRLLNVDLILQLIEELRDTEPRVRRRAIWKLAQISDSRSMQSLVDTMIDTDSYDRSLILEALSQICIRTLRPMNQALAISLQDKNPQVRKNALRDLTRMYNVMSQISQLVAHATDDPDAEVQETAKWAMKQLNLPMPVKLDIPDAVGDESEPSEASSYTESAELEN